MLDTALGQIYSCLYHFILYLEMVHKLRSYMRYYFHYISIIMKEV